MRGRAIAILVSLAVAVVVACGSGAPNSSPPDAAAQRFGFGPIPGGGFIPPTLNGGGGGGSVPADTVEGTLTSPDLVIASGPHTIANYGGFTCSSDKAATALSASGAGTCQFFFDAVGAGLSASGNTVSLSINGGSTQTCGVGTAVTSVTATGTTTCTAFLTTANVSGTSGDLAAFSGSNSVGNYAGTSCASDKATTAFSAGGAATCGYFVDSAGSGINVTNNVATLNINGGSTQSCSAGSAETAVTAQGIHTCSAFVNAVGTGLALSGSTASLNINGGSTQTCGASQAVTSMTSAGVDTCSSFLTSANLSGTTGDLLAVTGTNTAGNYAGSSPSACSAGQSITGAAFSAAGVLSYTCTAYPTISTTANAVLKSNGTSAVASQGTDDGTTFAVNGSSLFGIYGPTGRATSASSFDATESNWGSVAGYGDYARVGPAHLNWLANTDSLPSSGSSCAGTTGTWTICNSTSTLAATTVSVADPRGISTTVGKFTCTNGSGNCTSGGHFYQQMIANATTGVADVRSTQFTWSGWFQTTTGTATIQLSGSRYGGSDQWGAVTNCNISSTWTRCSVTGTTSSASLTDNSQLYVYMTFLTTTPVEVTGAQLNKGAVALPYQSNDGIAATSQVGLWANSLIVGSNENDPWLVYNGTTGIISNKGSFSNDQVYSLSVTPANGVTIKLNNNNASTIAVGTPVYSSVTGKFDLAKADAAATSMVVGLVADSAGVGTTQPGRVVVTGPLTLTTAQWDAVAGTSGGLTFATYYYLSDSTAGRLTSTKPATSGHYPVVVCQALSTTQCLLRVTTPPVANP